MSGPRGTTSLGTNLSAQAQAVPCTPRGTTALGAGLGALAMASPGVRRAPWSNVRGQDEQTGRTWAPPGQADRSVGVEGPVSGQGTLPTALPWEVDIYLSAGEAGDAGLTGPGGYRSCDLDDVSTCDIYRVRWSFAANRALSVERVVKAAPAPGCLGGTGAVQPAISPDGAELAWAESCGGPFGALTTQQVRVRHLGTGTEDEPLNLMGRSRWYPEWLDSSTLLYSEGRNVNAWSPFTHGSPRPQVTTANPNAVSWNNPRVHPDAAGPFGGTGPRMLTFGGPAEQEVPVDTDLAGDTPVGFDFGGIFRFDACHHPAWNADGSAVMCTRQFQPTPQGAASEVLLYRFDRTSILPTWGNPTVSFTVPTEAALEAAMGLDPAGDTLYPPAGSVDPSCRIRAWKYAQWCYSDEYIVATLYCTDQRVIERGLGIVVSRVVLIHLESATIYDITAEVEAAFGRQGRRYHGIFSTCGVPGCFYSS